MTSLLRNLTIRTVLVLAYALMATPAARAQADHRQCFKVKEANGTPSCAGGVCTITCNPGAANCNGLAADGCETNTQINHFHCGGCFLVCPPATPICAGGVCL